MTSEISIKTMIQNYKKYERPLFLTFTAIVFILGLVFRVLFIIKEGIFVDEAGNLPLSVMYFKAIMRFPPNVSILLLNPLKPEFYDIFYGSIGYIFNGLKLPKIVYLKYMWFVPPYILLYERIGILLTNCVLFIVTLMILSYIHINNRIYVLFSIFYWLNPFIIFHTSLVLTSSLVIPLSVLFLVSMFASKLNFNKFSLISAIVFGFLMSVQYYDIIFVIVPFLLYILYIKVYPPLKFLKFFLYFLGISLTVFILANPGFIFDPLVLIRGTLIATGTVLSTSSGVVGIPSYLFGRLTLTAPVYTVLVLTFFQTPVLILFSVLIGGCLFFYVSFRYKRENDLYNRDEYKMGFFTFSIFLINVIFTFSFNYLRRNELIIISPFILFSAISLDQIIEKIMCQERHSAEDSIKPFDKKIKNKARAFTILLIIFIIIISGFSVFQNEGNLPVYTNVLADVPHLEHQYLDGSWNSAQADTLVGKYIENMGIENETILTLALTSMVAYYAPYNNYIQIWSQINGTQLIKYYAGDYIVVDGWYAEIWGNPISSYRNDFNVIYIVNLVGGYSILARVK